MKFATTRIKNHQPYILVLKPVINTSTNTTYAKTIELFHQMEEDSIGKSVSFKGGALESSKSTKISDDGTKRRRLNSCFSFMEISIDPNVKSLKHLDSDKFKDGIKKWAKAVVTYARQVSQHFGSSRKSGCDEWCWFSLESFSGLKLCSMKMIYTWKNIDSWETLKVKRFAWSPIRTVVCKNATRIVLPLTRLHVQLAVLVIQEIVMLYQFVSSYGIWSIYSFYQIHVYVKYFTFTLHCLLTNFPDISRVICKQDEQVSYCYHILIFKIMKKYNGYHLLFLRFSPKIFIFYFYLH